MSLTLLKRHIVVCLMIVACQTTDSLAITASEKEATKWALIICGIPGDSDHHTEFSQTIESLHTSLKDQLGFPAENIRIQFGAPPNEEDGPAVQAADGTATRTELTKQVAELRKQIQPSDTLWVIVMGHAHFDGQQSYLNLPGAADGQSDLHASDFADLFRGLDAKQQLFFIGTPVSGFFVRGLSAEGRIVITATEADREVNATLFPAAFAETLAAPPAKSELDVDGNDQFSVFDLYIAVTRNVARRYLAESLLATEHAQLDDNGDGRSAELQLDYLSEEEGGRQRDGAKPPTIRQNSDGFIAQRTLVSADFPTPALTDKESSDELASGEDVTPVQKTEPDADAESDPTEP